MYDISFPNIGISIETLPKGITVFGFFLAFYGMIIACGMIAGIMVARWQAKRTGQDPDIYFDFALYAIFFAIIGARLYYVAFSFSQYKDNLLQIFNLRAGGLAIYGGVIAAVLTAFVFCKIKKYSMLLILDTACAGLVLGQVMGRWGNFFNREAFGEYTNSLLAMRLNADQVSRSNITETMLQNKIVENGITYIQVHPTFLYESLWNIVLFAVILLVTKKKKFNGQLFLIYMIGYGLGRAWIEGLRTDQLLVPGTTLAVSQLLSIGFVVVAVGLMIFGLQKAKKTSEH